MPDVIIPVLDEAAALPALLASFPRGYRPVVVDNGSTDGSGDIARQCGATVVTEPVRGFGSACWAGLCASDPADGVVCFMDGDLAITSTWLTAAPCPCRARPGPCRARCR